MDSFLHFIKHIIGFCGEPHPSLLMGGAGIISYCFYCVKNKYKKRKERNHGI